MKRRGQIICRRQHLLAGVGIGGIGGELAQAIEKCRQRSAHSLCGIRKNAFNLVQRIELSLGAALLLGFFVDPQLQQFIANALKLFQGHSVAEGQTVILGGGRLVQDRDLAAVSRCIYVGNVVGCHGQRALLSLQSLDRDGHRSV